MKTIDKNMEAINEASALIENLEQVRSGEVTGISRDKINFYHSLCNKVKERINILLTLKQ